MSTPFSAPFAPAANSFVGDMRAEPTDDPFAELLATLIGASGALAMYSRATAMRSSAPAFGDHATAAEAHDGAAANPIARAIAASRNGILALARRSGF